MQKKQLQLYSSFHRTASKFTSYCIPIKVPVTQHGRWQRWGDRGLVAPLDFHTWYW